MKGNITIIFIDEIYSKPPMIYYETKKLKNIKVMKYGVLI